MAISYHGVRGAHKLPDEIRETSLLALLSNSLVLCHVADVLPVSAVLSLSATSRGIRALLYHCPGVFRRLDLRPVKALQFDISRIDQGGERWRNVQLDENVTEDEYVLHGPTGFFPTRLC